MNQRSDTPMGETLTRAAAILRQKATDLREAHTVPPDHEEWRKDALAKEAEYAELMSVVAELGELERASETRTSLRQRIAQHVEGYSGQLPNHVLDCIVADIRNFPDE